MSAAASGFLTVLLGAFGAHALKNSLTPADLSIWQTAVHYQMFHTSALLVLGLMPAARATPAAGEEDGVERKQWQRLAQGVSPQRAIRVCAMPSWSRMRETMKSTSASTEAG